MLQEATDFPPHANFRGGVIAFWRRCLVRRPIVNSSQPSDLRVAKESTLLFAAKN